MAIDRPRVGGIDAFEQRRVDRRNGCPQPERTVDVHPCACISRLRADFLRGIEGAGVDVARLHADDGVLIECGQGIGTHASLAIGRNGDHAGAAEAQHVECFEHGDVNFLADDDANRRSSEHAVFFDIPADPLKQGRARCGQA